jgi:hypothetical protein
MQTSRFMHLWTLLFTSVLAFVFCFNLSRILYLGIGSQSWRKTDAKVLEITSLPKAAELRYIYLVESRQYVGDTFAFLSEGSLPDKELIQSNYHVGQLIEVYVSPSDPSQSVVLQRKVMLGYIWPYLVIIAFSIFLLIRSLRDLRFRKQATDHQP